MTVSVLEKHRDRREWRGICCHVSAVIDRWILYREFVKYTFPRYGTVISADTTHLWACGLCDLALYIYFAHV